MKYGVRVYERNSCVACDTPAPVPTNSNTSKSRSVPLSSHARDPDTLGRRKNGKQQVPGRTSVDGIFQFPARSLLDRLEHDRIQHAPDEGIHDRDRLGPPFEAERAVEERGAVRRTGGHFLQDALADLGVRDRARVSICWRREDRTFLV